MNLKQIAEMMRKEARRDGQVQQVLSGGLILVMRREGSTWFLSMKRRDTWPDAKEQAIVRRDFGIPKKIQGKKESVTGCRIIKLTWTDADEKATKVKAPKQLRLM